MIFGYEVVAGFDFPAVVSGVDSGFAEFLGHREDSGFVYRAVSEEDFSRHGHAYRLGYTLTRIFSMKPLAYARGSVPRLGLIRDGKSFLGPAGDSRVPVH